jgi:phosphatidylglycerophosphate synthase
MPIGLKDRDHRRRLRIDAARDLFAAAVLALAAAGLLVGVLGLSSAYPLRVIALFSLAVSAAVIWVTPGHPFDSFGPANRVTAIRAVLAALLAALAGEVTDSRTALLAIGLSVPALVLDGVDGRLARRSAMSSEFGARFDMEIDAAMVLVLATLAWRHGKAGPWLLLAGMLRYLFLAAPLALPWMRVPLPPSRRRQTVCVVLLIGLVVLLLPVIVPPLSVVLAMTLLALVGASFFTDTLWLARHAARSSADG